MKGRERARWQLLPIGLLSLGACATLPTPYQAAEGSGPGYRERKIEDNRFRVTFRGNAATSRERVESYLLYRAAELTLAHGHDYFVVADRQTRTETEYALPHVPVYGWYRHGHAGYGHCRFPYYAYGYPWGYATPYPTESRYEATAYIVMHDGQKPADNTLAYDAREVRDNLEPEIERPETPQ